MLSTASSTARGLRVFDERHFAHKLVTKAANRPDAALILGALRERLPGAENRSLDRARTHTRTRPKHLQELGSVHHARALLDQMLQQTQHFGLNVHARSAAFQLETRSVQLELSKPKNPTHGATLSPTPTLVQSLPRPRAACT